jgi:hypothetical protein
MQVNRVNMLIVTQEDLARVRKACSPMGMTGDYPTFLDKLEKAMVYQHATALHYTLQSIDFEAEELTWTLTKLA